jgi:hypothetical protein
MCAHAGDLVNQCRDDLTSAGRSSILTVRTGNKSRAGRRALVYYKYRELMQSARAMRTPVRVPVLKTPPLGCICSIILDTTRTSTLYEY